MTVQQIYDGSDGEATKALYLRLTSLGAIGVIAVNLFRAQKSSARAKVYRGGVAGHGSFRSMAYERKEWALANLCSVLALSAAAFELKFGWQRDEATPAFPWVLYVDLPTGQVSYHAPARGVGPEYSGTWDGIREASASRIVAWCQQLLDGPAPRPQRSAPLEHDELWCSRCAVWWRSRIECPGCKTRLVYRARSGGM